MKDRSLNNPQSAIRNPKSPVTDSPWFWVLLFSLVGIVALVAISGQYGKRQARLERQYQARERVAAEAVDDPSRPAYSTPDDTLVPLWPLGVALSGAATFAAWRLSRELRGHNTT